MLILTRRIGETIMIGENVRITVLNVNGRQIRLGIEAPKDVAVHREEIFLNIKGQNGGDRVGSFADGSTQKANHR